MRRAATRGDTLPYPSVDVLLEPTNGLWPQADLLGKTTSTDVLIDGAARQTRSRTYLR